MPLDGTNAGEVPAIAARTVSLRPPGEGKKVLVAMSGGVDSSVCAAVLKEQGYAVVGCFMRLGTPDEEEGFVEDAAACDLNPSAERASARGPASGAAPRRQGCCSVGDAADARHVAALLDIPFYVMNFRKDFGRIIDYFVGEYDAGRTPNPCVRCNDWLKFGKLHAYAKSIDCDYVASGHYARIERKKVEQKKVSGTFSLRRGVDYGKDQSYVLFGAPRARLAEMMLPIGELDKPAVRQIAEHHGLPVFDKPDSQEICFVPDNDYAGLVDRHTGGLAAGDIVDTAGAVVGRHGGHQRFTIGQRRGVGVALGYPIYVVDKDPAANTITVGPREGLLATGCIAGEVNWLDADPPADWVPCRAQVRYNSASVPAEARVTDSATGPRLEARFDEPVEAVTPGQAVVCYDADTDDRVLGGGWIVSAAGRK